MLYHFFNLEIILHMRNSDVWSYGLYIYNKQNLDFSKRDVKNDLLLKFVLYLQKCCTYAYIYMLNCIYIAVGTFPILHYSRFATYEGII